MDFSCSEKAEPRCFQGLQSNKSSVHPVLSQAAKACFRQSEIIFGHKVGRAVLSRQRTEERAFAKLNPGMRNLSLQLDSRAILCWREKGKALKGNLADQGCADYNLARNK
jgi:hypothetical protein